MTFNKNEFVDKLNARNNGIIITDAVEVDVMIVAVGSLKIDTLPVRLGVVEQHFIWGEPTPPQRLILSNRYDLEEGLYQCKTNGTDIYAVGAIGVRSLYRSELSGAIWKINPWDLTITKLEVLDLLSFDGFEITSNSIILKGGDSSASQYYEWGEKLPVRNIELNFDLNIIKSNVED